MKCYKLLTLIKWSRKSYLMQLLHPNLKYNLDGVVAKGFLIIFFCQPAEFLMAFLLLLNQEYLGLDLH